MSLKVKKVIIIPIIIIAIIISTIGMTFCMKMYNKTTYQQEYVNIIEKYAKEYKVDKNLIFAIVNTESDFKEDAVSKVGARGLMQLMPKTFDWVKTKLKDKTTTYDDMFDPEKNVKFGAYLICILLEEFDDNEAAIAAYHAGRGAVNKWLNDERYSDNKKNLKKIPISDTEHYVRKVMKSYEMYQEIYK
ncbi:MAG: lytic transglycosylase domain-containing protein [Oscillospiraceae bacterium]